MGQWEDRILSHGVWQSMETLGPAIDKALAREDIEPSTLENLERVRTVLAFAGKRLAGANPQLIDPRALDTIDNSLKTALSEILAFVDNGNVTLIANANSQADAILANLPAINYPFVADDWKVLSDAGKEYRKNLEQYLKRVNETRSKTLSDLEELRKTASDLQSQFSKEQESRNQEFTKRVDSALAQIQADSSSVQQKLAELSTEIGNERTRLTSLTSEFQGQFSTAQETRSKEYADAQTSRQDKFGNLIADYTQRLAEQNTAFSKQRDEAFQKYKDDVAELVSQYEESAKKTLDSIEGHKKQVEKLVGVIGNLGVTSGYLTTANYARKMTGIWQVATVAGLIVFIIFAFFAFLPSLTPGVFHWESFAGRVVLSLAVGVFAAYARSQGDKYFEIERRNRKLALELEAIGPYIASLPQEKQEEFRLKIGELSFGRNEELFDKSPATLVDVVGSEDFRKLVNEIVTTVVKAKGE
jgi:hypothetical protein